MENIPVFREAIFILHCILNFIFNQLQNLGVVNVALGIFFASFIYQILFLPFSIRKSNKKRTKTELKTKLDLLAQEYRNKVSDPAMLSEYNEKRKKIVEKRKKKKWVSLVLLFAQIFVLLCMFTSLSTMPKYVDVLNSLDEETLSQAYMFLGINLRKSANEVWWPTIILIVVYLIAFFLPNMIKDHIEKKKAYEEWLSGLSEEEKAVVKAEGGMKKDYSPMAVLPKLVGPALTCYFSVTISSFIVFYWLCNVLWRVVLNALMYLSVEKLWPRVESIKSRMRQKGKEPEGEL